MFNFKKIIQESEKNMLPKIWRLLVKSLLIFSIKNKIAKNQLKLNETKPVWLMIITSNS